MKKFLNLNTAPFLTMALGGLGLLTQQWLQQTGIDEKGLYISGHPAAAISFLFVPVALGILLFCCWPLAKKAGQHNGFPPSRLYGLLGILAFCVLCVHSIRELGAESTGFARICAWSKLLCGLCVGLITALSLAGKKPSYLFHAALTLFLIMIMVANYRAWSCETQLLVYFFPLMATAFMLLAGYQRTALAAGSGNHRVFCFMNMGGLFFCLMALPTGGLFFGGMAFWLLANLWSGKPLGKERSHETA